MDDGVTIVTDAPPLGVHVPTPVDGAMALKLIAVLHVSILVPASELTVLFVIVIELDDVQVILVPFVNVQINVFTPNGNPDTVVLLFVDTAIVEPNPPVHKPVSPDDGALAFNVPSLLHTSGVGVVGFDVDGVLLVTTTKSSAEHKPFTTVHLNV